MGKKERKRRAGGGQNSRNPPLSYSPPLRLLVPSFLLGPKKTTNTLRYTHLCIDTHATSPQGPAKKLGHGIRTTVDRRLGTHSVPLFPTCLLQSELFDVDALELNCFCFSVSLSFSLFISVFVTSPTSRLHPYFVRDSVSPVSFWFSSSAWGFRFFHLRTSPHHQNRTFPFTTFAHPHRHLHNHHHQPLDNCFGNWIVGCRILSREAGV